MGAHLEGKAPEIKPRGWRLAGRLESPGWAAGGTWTTHTSGIALCTFQLCRRRPRLDICLTMVCNFSR
jgi:hypothetical protein